MRKEKESEFVQLVRERYTPGTNPTYAEEADFLWLLNAPEQYDLEAEMLEYVKAHPQATARDLCFYFHEIVPPGLPPTIDPEELLRDDDE